MTHQVATCRPAPHALAHRALAHRSLSSSTALSSARALKPPTPAVLLATRRSSCRLTVRAVLDKSSSRSSDSRSGSSAGHGGGKVGNDALEAARSALERLFQQAHAHEQKQKLLGPAAAPADATAASVAFLEDAVQQLEVDLSAVFEALREKEGELALDERRVADERASMVAAREVLMAREAQLEERQVAQGEMRDEAEQLRRKVREQGAEVEEVKRDVPREEAALAVRRHVAQREEALGLAARAMGGLKRLTRKLVVDAESEMAGVMGGAA
ncbi:hypothetical protein CLOM_g13219 [Closterium sp. NIES-68]|nr:hypothetical protein CLOM_g2080 [Closterium sp. NIES-68]GJP54111.1 hypothetical protein CLOM_g13219 [Closterium sp. NIES-68]